jgi:hypothetical protein
MADRYWVGGTATWNNTAGTKWATTSGGSGGASIPTASDDVYFDANSGSGDIAIGASNCLNLDTTGFTGRFVGGNTSTPNIRGSLTVGSSNANWTKTGNMVFSPAAAAYVTITDSSQRINGATPITITGGAGSTVAIDTDVFCGSIVLTSGELFIPTFLTLSTNGTVTFTGAGNKTLTLGVEATIGTNTTGTINTGSATNLSVVGPSLPDQAYIVSGGNLTFSGSTNTVTGSGVTFTAKQNFTSDGKTFPGILQLVPTNSTTVYTITGANSYYAISVDPISFCNYSFADDQTCEYFSAISVFYERRVRFRSSVRGTQRTLTVNASDGLDNLLSNVDFHDIIGAGSADWDMTTNGSFSVGDIGNNSGITFEAGQTMYWVHGASASHTWSDINRWRTTSGGATTADRCPIAQDTAVFDANSFAANGRTVSLDTGTVGQANCDNLTNTASFTQANANAEWARGVTLNTTGSTMSLTGPPRFVGSGTITQNSGSLSIQLTINCGSGTYELGSDYSGTVLNFTSGTFNTQNYNMTFTTFSSTGNLVRTLNLGSSTLTSSITTNATFLTLSGSNLTFNAGTSNFVQSSTNSNTRTFAGGDYTFYNLTVPGDASIGPTVITGSNTFNEIIAVPNSKLRFTSGTTTTLANCNWTGTSGNLITIDASTSGTPANLSKASGTVTCDYLSLKDSAAGGGATWNAGSNSTNVSGNSGWNFGSGPTSNAIIINMVGI